MICQHCRQNTAVHHLTIRNGPQSREVHLCPVCAEALRRRYLQSLTGWRILESDSQTAGTERFQRRRRLTELRGKLASAVEAEDYEAAAKLRDTIKREEKACGEPSPHKTTIH